MNKPISQMKLVVLESPFKGANLTERMENIDYARRAARRCAMDGEAILASHLLFPQFLDEDVEAERDLGIRLGLAWVKRADYSVFFTDRGWSKGMEMALTAAVMDGRRLFLRSLDGAVKFPWGKEGDWEKMVDMERGIRK